MQVESKMQKRLQVNKVTEKRSDHKEINLLRLFLVTEIQQRAQYLGNRGTYSHGEEICQELSEGGGGKKKEGRFQLCLLPYYIILVKLNVYSDTKEHPSFREISQM